MQKSILLLTALTISSWALLLAKEPKALMDSNINDYFTEVSLHGFNIIKDKGDYVVKINSRYYLKCFKSNSINYL